MTTETSRSSCFFPERESDRAEWSVSAFSRSIGGALCARAMCEPGPEKAKHRSHAAGAECQHLSRAFWRVSVRCFSSRMCGPPRPQGLRRGGRARRAEAASNSHQRRHAQCRKCDHFTLVPPFWAPLSSETLAEQTAGGPFGYPSSSLSSEAAFQLPHVLRLLSELGCLRHTSRG